MGQPVAWQAAEAVSVALAAIRAARVVSAAKVGSPAARVATTATATCTVAAAKAIAVAVAWQAARGSAARRPGRCRVASRRQERPASRTGLTRVPYAEEQEWSPSLSKFTLQRKSEVCTLLQKLQGEVFADLCGPFNVIYRTTQHRTHRQRTVRHLLTKQPDTSSPPRNLMSANMSAA